MSKDWFLAALGEVLTKSEEWIDLKPTEKYKQIKEEKFLSMKIPLPSLEEQRRIVARVEELVGKIEEARSLRQKALEETQVLQTQ